MMVKNIIMNREKKLIKNTIILGVGTFLPRAASFITLPILTAMLTKAEYGTYDLIAVLVSLLIPIITLELKQAAFRFMIEYRNEEKEIKQIISNVYFFVLPLSIIVLTVLFFVLPVKSIQIRAMILIYLFLEVVLDLTRQIVRGFGNTKQYSAASIISALCNLLFIVILIAVFSWGLTGVLLSFIIAAAVSAIYLLLVSNILSYIDIHACNKSSMKKLLRYSFPLIPNSISMWIVQLSDRLVILAFLGVEANALYAVAQKIPNLLNVMYGVFNLSWQENASEFINDKDSEQYYSFIFDKLFSFLVGLMAVLIAATPILFLLFIRGDYGESYYQMPILYFAVLFSCFSYYYGGIHIALKKTKSLGITSAAGAIINLIIDLLFIKQIGLYAASISTLVSQFAICVFRFIEVRKLKTIKYNWKRIGLCLSVLIIMCVLCYQRNLYLDIINIICGVIFAVILNKSTIWKLFRQSATTLRSIIQR